MTEAIDITSASARRDARLRLRALLEDRHFSSRSARVQRKHRADHRAEPVRIPGSRWERLTDGEWVRVD